MGWRAARSLPDRTGTWGSRSGHHRISGSVKSTGLATPWCYMRIEMPRKRLISGMGGEAFVSRIQCFRSLARHLQPESVWTEINLLVPDQFAEPTDAGVSKELVVLPASVYTCAGFGGEINDSFHPIVKLKANAKTI